MHCASCEIIIADYLKEITELKSVKVDRGTGELTVEYAGDEPPTEKIRQAVETAGYEMAGEKATKSKIVYVVFFVLLLLTGTRFWPWLEESLRVTINPDSLSSKPLSFLVLGVFAGFSSCFALVGGLVLSISADFVKKHSNLSTAQKIKPHLYFNFGRVAGFAILGGILGLIGKTLGMNEFLLGILIVFAGFMMFFFGLKLTGIFPWLNKISISSFGWIKKFRFIADGIMALKYKNAKSVLVGALTFFLPCGFTQSAQFAAASAGDFRSGAVLMGLFALGTMPGLIGIGGISSFAKGRFGRWFFSFSAIILIFFGYVNLKNGFVILSETGKTGATEKIISNDFQELRITQDNFGYHPNALQADLGRPMRLIVESKSLYSCASSFRIPEFGINQKLALGENVMEFFPKKKGEINFSCSMGMYKGKIIVQ